MDHRLWMYDMCYEIGGIMKPELFDGVREFIDHAMSLKLFQRSKFH